MDRSPLGSSVHGRLQVSILQWVAIPSSRGCSQPRDWTQVCCIAGRFFTIWTTREAGKPLHQLSKIPFWWLCLLWWRALLWAWGWYFHTWNPLILCRNSPRGVPGAGTPELSPLAREPAYTTSRSGSRIRQRATREGVVSSGRGWGGRRLDPRPENRRWGVSEMFLDQETIWKRGKHDAFFQEEKESLLCPGAYPQIKSQVWVLEAPFFQKNSASMVPTSPPGGGSSWFDLLTFLNLLAQEASDYLPKAAPPAAWSQRARTMTM